MNTIDVVHASFTRRLMAIIYDIILVIAVAFCLFIFVLFIPQDAMSDTTFLLLRRLYLCLIFYGYFVLNWKYYRQTPGMRIWKLSLISKHNKGISWHQVNIRFATALIGVLCFGLGFIIAFFNAQRNCWHDNISQTQLVVINQRT